MALDLPVSIRITGARDASGKVGVLGKAALRRIQLASQRRAEKTVTRFRTEMDREYTSAWATHRLARGITFKAFVQGNGVDVKFFIEDRRELRYVTAALGGEFQQFPVGPFVIRPSTAKALAIPLVGRARRFIRGEHGRLAGSREGTTLIVKKVLWGRKSGGFSRDVISEVSEQEGALFVQDVQDAVGIAIQEVIR